MASVHAHAAGGAPTVLFQQATSRASINDIYINGVASHCRKGAPTITQWFANKFTADGKDIPISWNAAEFTGFSPANPAGSQLGITNAQYGGTVIQSEGGTQGWQIETTTAAPNNPAANFIAGICSAATICDDNGNETKVHPFADPNMILRASIDLQVPYSNNSNGTVNTASQMIYFIDPTVPPAGLGFWYSFAHYSSVDQAETVIFDAGTSSAVIGAFPGTDGRFSIDVGGARLQRAPWRGFQTFNVALTPTNLRNAVQALKAAAQKAGDFTKYGALSEDPAVYVIGGSIVDTEVARVGHDGGMGLSYRNIQLSLLTGGQGCGPDGRPLAWSCGSGRPNSQWVDAGGGCYHYASGQACH